LLNPEPEEQQSNADWYKCQNSSEDDESLMNQGGQTWRRYSAPSLSSDSSSKASNANSNDLIIINCCNGASPSQASPDNSVTSQSMPASPMPKHLNISSSSTSASAHNGNEASTDKVETPSRRSSSSVPSSRRSSMNRAGQAITSSNSSSNMITPPQTPGIKSPTKANFSFPPNSTGSTTSNDQSNNQPVPQKVKRKRITQEQLQDLVAMFEQTDTPSYDVREKLAKKLSMTNREVQVNYLISNLFFIYKAKSS